MLCRIIDKRRGRLAISHMTVAKDVRGASLELELGWAGTFIALYIMRYDGGTVRSPLPLVIPLTWSIADHQIHFFPMGLGFRV